MRWLAVIGLCVIHSLNVSSQKLNLSFEHLNAEDGIEGKYNDFIFKDSRGFVWISSTTGLHRYDGVEIDLFTPETLFGKGMLGRNIQSRCLEDINGNIWFSTLEGIHCYDWKRKKINAFQFKNNERKIVDKDYNSFHLEQDSILWTIADESIYRFNIVNYSYQKIGQSKGVRFTVDSNGQGEVTKIIASCWAKQPGFEILQISDGRIVKIDQYLDNGMMHLGIKHVEVTGSLIQNENKKLWLFTDRGLLSMDLNNSNSIKQFSIPQTSHCIVNDGIVLDDEKLILSVENSGLWIFDTKALIFKTNISNVVQGNGNLVSTSVREVYLDAQDNIWVASKTSAEVDHSWLYCNRFVNPLSSYSVSVNSIVEDGHGMIWCSTLNSGIFKLDQSGRLVQRFEYGSGKNISNILHLRSDRENNIWAQSKQNLFKYNEDKGSWMVFYEANEERLHDFIFPNDSLVLVASSIGLDLYKYKNKEKCDTSEGVSLYPDNRKGLQVFHLFPVKSEKIYLPIKSSELWVYDLRTSNTIKYELGSETHSVWESEDQSSIWLGTLDGLKSIHLAHKDSVNHIDFDIHNLQVLSVVQDENQRLWMATNEGVYAYQIDIGNIFSFQGDVHSSLISDRFTLFGHFKSSSGRIWFGMDQGIVSFLPEEVNPYPQIPIARLHSIKINSKLVSSQENLIAQEKLNLRHYQNQLELDIRSMSSFQSHLNKIKFRISNDNKWNYVKNGEGIILDELIPGEHNLIYSAVNANGIVGEENILRINIAKPILQQNWFRAGILTVSILWFFTLFRLYIKRKLRQQRRQFEREEALNLALQQERNRIAYEMHDDLGGGLTSIRLLLKKLKIDELPETTGDQINKVEMYAGELIESMSDIIWAMNSSNDNLTDLLTHIRRYCIRYFDDHELKCDVDIPVNVPMIQIGGRKRRNIYLCIKECCHNVLKHSNATNVTINFEWNGNLLISISDNGDGLSQVGLQSGGMGIQNMRERMAEINGILEIKFQNGCMVIFDIPLQL